MARPKVDPLQRAFARYVEAEARVKKAMEARVVAAKMAFPIGCHVLYEHGDDIRLVEVVSHNNYWWCATSVGVRGVTGAVYRLDTNRIVAIRE